LTKESDELDLSKYPTLRRLAAHNRAHVHERVGQSCEWCDVDRELRALVKESTESGALKGAYRVLAVMGDFANWAYNGAPKEYPSNVLDMVGEAARGVLSGRITGRLRITSSEAEESERAP